MKAPVLSYHTKWPTGWKSEWFYVKADEKKREKLKTLVLSPLSLSFGLTRPLCRMTSGSPCQQAVTEFKVVAEHISTRDLVQEYLANKTSPTLSKFSMPKLKGTKKGLELVRLPYRFKFEKQFKEPCQEWLVTPGFRDTKTRARTSSPGVLGPSLTHMMNHGTGSNVTFYYITGVLYKINK